MTRDDAQALDLADPLARFRGAFDLPDGVIYLDGNSLGAPPRRTLARLRQCAEEEWRSGLIRSWNDAGWIDLPARAGAKIARLIGANASDVIVTDSVSNNIFKLAGALLARRPGRALCVEASEFPTDQYVLEGLARLSGARLIRLSRDELAPAGAILVKSLVHYKTAAVADMAACERAATRDGTDIIWDLSHATGVIAVDASGSNARFAVGCGYKYLNGGPGAPAFVYARSDEAGSLQQPLSGWMGAKSPFAFSSAYEPADGVRRFAAGTAPILSLAALDASLDLFADIDCHALETKARGLGDLFLAAGAAAGLPPIEVAGRRGGHVTFRHEDGYAVVQALIARGVIGDFRAPDLARFGFSPLYLSYTDVWRAGEILKDVMASGIWRDARYARRAAVT
ncbi:MAG: aminotransferase class V-fold PLP-dependent enzyme [Parvularculaceae bacterium]|nr:aminotransferase class V-fold PLP-dependent enzyme [Parvularculaceae bacterium]